MALKSFAGTFWPGTAAGWRRSECPVYPVPSIAGQGWVPAGALARFEQKNTMTPPGGVTLPKWMCDWVTGELRFSNLECERQSLAYCRSSFQLQRAGAVCSRMAPVSAFKAPTSLKPVIERPELLPVLSCELIAGDVTTCCGYQHTH